MLGGIDVFGEIKGLIALIKNPPPVTQEINQVFQEPEGLNKPFTPHYQEHIHPHIMDFESDRISALITMRSRAKIAIPAGVVLVILSVIACFYFRISGDGAEFILYVNLAAISGLSYWVYKPEIDYKADVKNIIFPNIFSYFGEDFQFKAKVPFKMDQMKPSSILPSYNMESLEDYIEGSYKEVDLELFEAHLKVKGDKSSRTTFKGFCVLLSMNKNFSGKTIVKRDGGAVGNFFGSRFKGAVGGLENVKLEDPVFEEMFEVYSDDQVEARYLLTTSFMERLLKLVTLYGSKGVQCSFYDDKLFLMISSKRNMFEASSVFVPATFHDDIQTILEEMPLIFQIIDVLKLNERTGL